MSIYSKWLTLCKYLFNQDYRDYRFVRRLHIFDSEYYLALLKHNDENVGDSGTSEAEDPLWLYFQTFREEYDQGIDVSGDWEQLNDPHPLFDTCYYLSKYKSKVGTRNPFSHYLRKGWKEGLRPSPMFDADFYHRHGKWDRSQGDPLTHFAHHGLTFITRHHSWVVFECRRITTRDCFIYSFSFLCSVLVVLGFFFHPKAHF